MAEPITHFEITADDPVRAAAFYRDSFGWTITKWDGPANYWLVSTGEGGRWRMPLPECARPRGRSSTRSTRFLASVGSRT
jgi:hypothetical protein